MAPTAARTAVFPEALDPVADRVEARIDALLESERQRWVLVDDALADPLDELREFVAAGGKRLRPAFCEARRGPARRFGDGMAILVGDFALVYADVLLRGAPEAAQAIFDELRVELCVGQSLDLVGTATARTDAATARRIATYKSGKYTVERPLHLGAALSGRAAELSGPLSAVGLPMGEAFQLRDDVLGAFGESSVTGKPVGDDLRAGTPTPLIAIATARASAQDDVLLARLGSADLTDDDVAALQALFVRTGALDDVEVAIERLVVEARTALASTPITETARAWLDELAAFVAWRDS